jgi:hypothetical protein
MCIFFVHILNGQDSVANLPDSRIVTESGLSTISKEAANLQRKLDKLTRKSIKAIQNQENELQQLINEKNSALSGTKQIDIHTEYLSLQSFEIQINDRIAVKSNYLPFMDTLKTALNFLSIYTKEKKPDISFQNELSTALHQVNGLDKRLKESTAAISIFKERKEQLTQQLSQLGVVRQMEKYNRQLYYYSQKLKTYHLIIADRKRREQKAIEMIRAVPEFQAFFRKHSELAQLFPAPSTPLSVSASLSGLQTRSMVQTQLKEKVAQGDNSAVSDVSQAVQQAQLQLNRLKEKVVSAGGSSSDFEMPDFKNVNTQRSKTFWQRLNFGFNIQNTAGSTFVPRTTDLGLSMGYRLDEKRSAGLGLSYKMGLGNGFRNIEFSHMGLGLRSYLDWKIKNSFYLAAGFEFNYLDKFQNLQQLRREIDNWSKSALLGLSKKYRIGKKWKGDIRLLYDFMSKMHAPVSQPVLFRFGYSL